MALPAEVHVRISSEAAGAITMTPVVHQSMPVRELIEVILSTAGKEEGRIRDLLRRGSVVQGASRFRWQPLEADTAELSGILASFPDPDPRRPFRAADCIGVRFHAGPQTMELPRQIASERRFFRRRTFWDALIDVAGRSAPQYCGYSYRTRSDEYRVAVTAALLAELREAAGLLRYSGLAAQVRRLPVEWIEYSVRFP